MKDISRRLRRRGIADCLPSVALLTAILSILAGPFPAFAETEGCHWASGFGTSDLDFGVRALVVYDDDRGEALYAGGDFTTAGGITVNHVARWDGTAWSALAGPEGIGTSGSVHALAVYDDGNGEALYAAGEYFSSAGGVTTGSIAKWDGEAWSALVGPAGVGPSYVRALTVYDDGNGEALYVGGDFTTAGGITVNHLARWDGEAWSALVGPAGTGTDDDVFALAVHDDGSGPALYVAGSFYNAGGLWVPGIAKWDGAAWSPVGIGGVGRGYALAVYDDGSGEALYAVGGSLRKWDGEAWSTVADSAITDGKVFAFAVYDDGAGEALFMGGTIYGVGEMWTMRIARWNGAEFSTLDGPNGNGLGARPSAYVALRAMAVYDDGNGPALYAGGDFTTAGGIWVNRIAKWDGHGWAPVTDPASSAARHGISGTGVNVRALAAYDDGSGEALYAGGGFYAAGGVMVDQIARWDGEAWSAFTGPGGTGADGSVHAFAVYDDGTGEALYAGGGFKTMTGVWVNRVAKWDGEAWSALNGTYGPGVGTDDVGTVHALAVYDDGRGPALYVGGIFPRAGALEAYNLARWDGAEWSAVADPSGGRLNGSVEALAVYDDGAGEALYAAGNFTTAGETTVNGIVRWDGTAWSALSGPAGSGTSMGYEETVNALAVHDDGTGKALYVAGRFFTAGGVEVHNVARWDGTAWSALSGTSEIGVSYPVYALTVYDDGTGEALYVGGHRIAKWDGDEWSSVTVTDNVVSALGVYNDGTGEALFAGGKFTTVDAIPSSRIAQWTCHKALYLNNQRFKVEVTWGDFHGNSGQGRSVPLTDETGYFWFFDEDNIELVVKALDACVDPFDRFWVFAAGLTNVEVTMTVTDTVTDTRKEYFNPLNQPFAPILDTDAFATCPAKQASLAPSPARELAALETLLSELPQQERSRGSRASELHLNQSRFRVEVAWSDFAGHTGSGRGVELTDETGYFWFFSEDNIELVVKILDACVDPFNRYWVFAAGLTNVEVRMTVTDTVSGEEKVYFNPLQQDFAPILDTDAFATCGAAPK